jgi:hypothetical protein
MLCCSRCCEPVVTPEGIIDLNKDGECDACVEQAELVAVLAEDERRYGDHDFSMNG